MRYLIAVLCALAVVSAQVLYGGAMRPVFALPALLMVALAGALGLVGAVWRNVPAPSFSCVLSVLAFAGWLIWRTMESPDAWLAAGYLRLILGCLVTYLIFACAITNPFHRLAFFCVLFLAAVIQTGAAAWQFARPETGPLIPWLSEQLRIWYASRWNARGHGSYLNGNHLVWFLNVVGMMAISLTCWGRWGLKVKILCLYVALGSFAGSLVTLSRGGLLGLGVGITVFLLLSALALAVGARDRRIAGMLVIVATVVAAGSTAFLLFRSSQIVQKRFEELLIDTYRPALFEVVIRQVQLEPWKGTGAGTFLYYGRLYREILGFEDDIYAHNDWAQIAGDFGVAALFLLMVLVGVHAAFGMAGLLAVLKKRMAAHSRPQSHAAALIIGALVCLAVFVVHSIFDFNMQIPANALLASTILGILANPGVTPDGRASWEKTFFRRLTCAGTGLLAIWLMVLCFRAAAPEYFWLRAENAQLEGRPGEAWVFAEAGLISGRHVRLDRTLGEIYLSAAMRSELSERRKWARAAARHFEYCVAVSPLDGRNYLLLAEARRLEGRGGLAGRTVLEAIRYMPSLGRGYESYGEILEEAGRFAEAKQAYLVAAGLPGNSHARKSAAELAKKIKILEE